MGKNCLSSFADFDAGFHHSAIPWQPKMIQ